MPDHPNRPKFAVDWDDTCVAEYRPDGTRYWPDSGPWLVNAIPALHALARQGKTVVYTLRTHLLEYDHETRRWHSDVEAAFKQIRARLDEVGLHEVEVYDTRWGKPPADYYVDDKAVRFRGNWEDTLREIHAREAAR